jgi:hypothetical protein
MSPVTMGHAGLSEAPVEGQGVLLDAKGFPCPSRPPIG